MLSLSILDNCPKCSNKKDRDFNASRNLENYQALAAGSVALRSMDGVLPTVPCEVDGKHV